MEHFPDRFMALRSWGNQLWCLLFAVHRALVQLFRSYVLMSMEEQHVEDAEA